MANNKLIDLDEEWMKLVKEFMESGVTKEEFSQFLEMKKAEKAKKIDYTHSYQ